MKAKKKARSKPYRMPIPHERFAHMLTALLAHIQHLQQFDGAAVLNQATAHEIADAVCKLRAIYCDELLRHTRPNRRVSRLELRDAANAQMLVDFYGFDSASAMEAVAGNPREVERDSLARTLRNRSKMIAQLGVEPDLKVVAAAVNMTKKKAER